MVTNLREIFEQAQKAPEEAAGDSKGPVTQNAKTEARLIAVQAVYRYLLLEDSNEDIQNTFNSKYLKGRKANKALFRRLLEGVIAERERYQQMLEPLLSENWQWERVGYVEKAILFCAVAELDICQDTPLKVILNEYLTIAHSYFEAGEVGFINGVLDKAAKMLRG